MAKQSKSDDVLRFAKNHSKETRRASKKLRKSAVGTSESAEAVKRVLAAEKRAKRTNRRR